MVVVVVVMVVVEVEEEEEEEAVTAAAAAADVKEYILTQQKQFCSKYPVICNFIYFYKMHFLKFYFNVLYS